MTTQPPETSFRYIKPGIGGTFTFSSPNNPGDQNQVPYIGTILCTTGVGIYFRIDVNRCFCAHIMCDSLLPRTKNQLPGPEGYEIQRKILKRLVAESKNEAWNFRDNIFGKDITVVCPCLEPDGLSDKRDTLAEEGRFPVHAIIALRELFREMGFSLSERADNLAADIRVTKEVIEVARAEEGFKEVFDFEAKQNELKSLRQRVEELRDLAMFSGYSTCSGFIVNHSTRIVITLGNTVYMPDGGDFSQARVHCVGLRHLGHPNNTEIFRPVEEPGVPEWLFATDSEEQKVNDLIAEHIKTSKSGDTPAAWDMSGFQIPEEPSPEC